MNPILYELMFGKKGSMFLFGRGSKPGIFDGMRGYKKWDETYIIKDPDTKKYHTIPKTWDDSEEIYD